MNVKEQDKVEWLLVLFVVIVALLALSSCGPRLSDGQAQALSNARSGALAAQQKRKEIAAMADPVRANIESQALLDDLTRGAFGFTIGATTNLALPAPTFTPVMLLTKPEQAPAYAAAGLASMKAPPKGWSAGAWATAGTVALGALGLILKLGRNIPGVGGTVATILSPLWDHFVSDDVKAKEAAIDDGLDVAIVYGEHVASIARQAGYGSLVDAAKQRATFLADKLGAQDEVARRLALARSGVIELPALPAPVAPPTGGAPSLPVAST